MTPTCWPRFLETLTSVFFAQGARHCRRSPVLIITLALWLFLSAVPPATAQDHRTAADSMETLFRQGVEAYNQGSRDGQERAIQLWLRATSLARGEGKPKDEGVMLNYIGTAHERLGRLDSALVYFRASLAILRAVRDRAGEGKTLNDIGLVHSESGRPDSALVYYGQALVIRRDAADSAGEGQTLNNIGAVHHRLGRPDSAFAYYRQALAIRRQVRDRRGEGTTLQNIGLVHAESGRPDSALAYYRQALAIQHEVRNRRGEGTTLNNIGLVHGELGRPDSALVYYRRALTIRREVGDPAGEGTTLNNIGLVYLALGRPDSALAHFRQALAISRTVRDRAGEGTTLTNIGYVHGALGHRDSALADFRQALAIARDVRDRVGEGTTLNNMGLVHSESGHPDSALALYREALAIRRKVEDRAGERATLRNIAWLHRYALSPPDLFTAVAYYDSAAAAVVAVGAHSGGEANRVSYAEQQVGLFEGWTLAWLARAPEVGRSPSALAALAAAERGRAQSLLELLRRSSNDATSGRDLVAEGTDLLAAGVSGGAAVLSYLITADTVVLWFALPGHDVEVLRRAVPRDTMAEAVRSLRAALGVGEAARDRVALRGGASLEADALGVGVRPVRAGSLAVLSRTLAGWLLPPELDRRLDAVQELVIIPHGVLGLVPFAVLPVDAGGTPLGSRYALRYAPSLAVLEEVEGRPGLPAGATRAAALRQALVVGNPTMPKMSSLGDAFELKPLPGAETEGRWVADRLGAVALTGAQASEADVRRRLPGAPVVHLATHGYAYATEARARLSFVALAPSTGHDGFLTVGEVLDDPALKLSADLVVLSACQTGLGDLKQAEGTVGLQRAFLAKGARSVLVSLWNVSDESTALLMEGFYTHWLTDPDHPSKAEALRRAQEAVRARPEFRDAKFWAAFQLVGAP